MRNDDPGDRDSSVPRPFVGGGESPRQTPPEGQGIQRPFVSGMRTTPASGVAAAATGTELPPITSFLYAEQTPPAAPQYAPPIPGFTPAPSSARYTPSVVPQAPEMRAAASTTASPPQDRESWATGEWQRYDWQGAATLAPDDSNRAAQAWSDLDWDEDARERGRARAETVAASLERIAKRIRAGELTVSGEDGMTDEAATAAALAALLAQRR